MDICDNPLNPQSQKALCPPNSQAMNDVAGTNTILSMGRSLPSAREGSSNDQNFRRSECAKPPPSAYAKQLSSIPKKRHRGRRVSAHLLKIDAHPLKIDLSDPRPCAVSENLIVRTTHVAAETEVKKVFDGIAHDDQY
jgi:hypothetical protein